LLHAWIVLALALCAILASLSLVRGVAGLLVARAALGRLEAAALFLAGIAGWIGATLVYHWPA
jgi:hypothetical protein